MLLAVLGGELDFLMSSILKMLADRCMVKWLSKLNGHVMSFCMLQFQFQPCMLRCRFLALHCVTLHWHSIPYLAPVYVRE